MARKLFESDTLARLLRVKRSLDAGQGPTPPPAADERTTRNQLLQLSQDVAAPSDEDDAGTLCINCGYNQRGVFLTRCPECGLPLAAYYHDPTRWGATRASPSAWWATALEVWTHQRSLRVRGSLIPATPAARSFARWSALATAVLVSLTMTVADWIAHGSSALALLNFAVRFVSGTVLISLFLLGVLYCLARALKSTWRGRYPYCDTRSGSYSLITWNGSMFGVVSGKENLPMVQVGWYGAVAYANWRSAMQGKPLCYDLSTWTCNFGSGYRLPTEAEWEKAARGGVAGHRFPWSDTDTIQHARANYYSLSDYPYDTSPTRGYHPTFNTGVYPYTSPVGYFAPNGYGLYDMAGNVWEWCNDWYGETYYSSSAYSNPHGPTSGSYRILRGGCWYQEYAFGCRVARRSYYGAPGNPYYHSGFRLALDSE